MKEVTMETPLRTIVLQYDESKPETAYEKELIEMYVAIHHTYFNMVKDVPKLKYEYTELKYQIEQATKGFQPLKQQIETLHKKASAALNNPANDNWDLEVMEELTLIHTAIDEYHNEIVTPIFDEHNRLIDVVQKMDDADEEFIETDWSDYRDFTNELYSNYDNYSLDLVSFDNDDDTMREKFSNFSTFSSDTEIDNALFDAYHELVKNAYDEFNVIKEMVANKHNNTGLMDKEISDSCANGELAEDLMPKYLIPAGDKKIEDFKISYSLLASNDNHTLNMAISQDLIADNNIGTITDLILCFQHYPKLIQKMIFAIDFKFENEYGNEIAAEDWKGVNEYVQYISLLQTLPFSIFFFQDQDVRAYIFLGDMLLNGRAKPLPDGTINFDAETMNELCNRMFHFCWSFMMYCYNTGFDPKDYVSAILADFDLPVTYEHVKEKFDADIKTGVQIRVVPQNMTQV